MKSQKIKIIYLEVSIDNKPARQLYESLGFQQEGIRRNYYKKGDQAEFPVHRLLQG